MKDSIKGIILVVVAIAAGVVGYILYSGTSDFQGYWYICAAVGVVALGFGIKFILDNSSPAKAYDSNIRNILNTFDSILVQSNAVPKLEGRNIIYVETIDDLVDAQLEIRKPICYILNDNTCSFILLDAKDAYVYYDKRNDNNISLVEIEIENKRKKMKDDKQIDSELLKSIENTTIVKLSDLKAYKISPIKKLSNEIIDVIE